MTPALPAGWPDGRGLAISVSIMLEGWSEDAAPGVGPMGNVLPGGTLDLQARSWADYGPKVGAWRLLDILEAAKVRAVFYVSGVLADPYAPLVRAIVDAGHVVAAHGWSQHIMPATQSEAQEQADLTVCIAALKAASGTRPPGWLSPRCTPSLNTPRLLAAAGMAWHADYFDEDLPRPLDTGAGRLTAVPFTMDVNDMPMSVRYGNETEAYSRTLRHILEGLPLLPMRPACLDITVHAHVYGRPAGAIEFSRALSLAADFADRAWLTDHDSLGRLFSRA
jgi:peptidoglycan/xylan/chitin deacetylase (PgdA/CDA1 family)